MSTDAKTYVADPAAPLELKGDYCPVCGFFEVDYTAEAGSICGACGTELGFNDQSLSHAELYREWVSQGCPWFDTGMPEPPNWRAHCQVLIQALPPVPAPTRENK
jgi:hypothetical protein